MITDNDNNLITKSILNLYFTHDAIKVRNQLLDGSYHTQSIGDAIKVANLECEITEDGKLLMDECFIFDKALILEFEGKRYVGYLDDEAKWDLIIKGKYSNRLYISKFKVIIESEGVL